MADFRCEIMDALEGKKPQVCDSGCKNFRFPHLDCACVLSEVFSVEKGKPCFIYEPREV